MASRASSQTLTANERRTRWRHGQRRHPNLLAAADHRPGYPGRGAPDDRHGEYLPFCDAFYFAVAPEFPQDILPEDPGLIVADAFGGAVIRPPPHTPLAGARRKALTIAFARLAAGRVI
jgi:hypothetical protein